MMCTLRYFAVMEMREIVGSFERVGMPGTIGKCCSNRKWIKMIAGLHVMSGLRCPIRAIHNCTLIFKGHWQLHPRLLFFRDFWKSRLFFTTFESCDFFSLLFESRDFLFSLRYSLLFETVISGDSFIILLRTQRRPWKCCTWRLCV